MDNVEELKRIQEYYQNELYLLVNSIDFDKNYFRTLTKKLNETNNKLYGTDLEEGLINK